MIEKIQIQVKDFKDSSKVMPYESLGRAFVALMAYASDEEPTDFLGDDIVAQVQFQNLKGHVERMEEFRINRANAGRNGGLSKAKQSQANDSKAKQTLAKVSKTKQTQAPIPNPIPIPNPKKNIYGANNNVLLTDEEFETLKTKFPDYQTRIDDLSFYLSSKGASYKSHYMTILSWARKESKQGKVVSKNQFTNMTQSNIDFEELEKKLVKN